MTKTNFTRHLHFLDNPAEARLFYRNREQSIHEIKERMKRINMFKPSGFYKHNNPIHKYELILTGPDDGC